ncbi:endoplasmic reticulum aminopeptidase 2-like [Centroberyx gerrardi]|uniref:endoplasmic reticulum aminopeptidase 2-like n=1 Tax=Centroberyx gerrardi TaxID=166262 RepID=UPI003AB0A40B
MLSTILYLLWALITVRADQKLQPDEVNTVTPPEETFPWSQPRLPTSIKPEHYFLSVHPDVGSDSFTGQVRILITVVNDTSFIILNSKDLVIQEATLLGLSVPSLIYQEARPVQSQMLHRANVAQEKLVKQPMALRVLESEATEQLALLMDTPLVAGHKYQLSLSYSGKFSDSNSGIYKASYRTPADAAPRTIVATHFEPSAARKAFPCFDEPSMKAVFSLVVVRRSEHISLSNMPKLHTEAIEDGLEQDYYQTSVRMSSYLVAFVICDYAVNSAETKRGVKVSVFAANHLINQTHYALQSAVEIMDIYEQLFQIAYPLPKLDLVAVPDVEAVGTESWGLVTFREASLLYQEQRESRRSRLRVSLLTAHELAHQWFGNLVTMHCWRDVWLKEGFASYLEHIAVRHLKPDWCVVS